MHTSFVVQGTIQPFTKECCVSIRRHFPEAEIVLSTWSGEDCSGIDRDVTIASQDVAPGKMNVRRQVVSSMAGILASSGDIIVKARSDAIFCGRGCLEAFGAYDKPASVFSQRIVIPNMQTVDPENQSAQLHWRRCFNPSDWVMVGAKGDMRLLFSLPMDGCDETKLSPEQFIWLRAVRTKHDIRLEDMNQITPELKEASNRFFARDLVVLDTYSQFQMESGKYSYQKEDEPHFMRNSTWRRHYDSL